MAYGSLSITDKFHFVFAQLGKASILYLGGCRGGGGGNRGGGWTLCKYVRSKKKTKERIEQNGAEGRYGEKLKMSDARQKKVHEWKEWYEYQIVSLHLDKISHQRSVSLGEFTKTQKASRCTRHHLLIVI